ncbi:Cysteine-rich receptor-like protein kinase 25 [Carex littledalei]|uniref:non-specific serine/threonine protein kinase n=1 Tax=Carex littledalei TaxID=544730 RepID=A0A833QLK6_9POAL|nr:Cysteine-rich receptor-like protein kinase 25 [Carex littledalei]
MDRIGVLIATFMLFFITVDGKGSNNGNTIIMPLTIAAGLVLILAVLIILVWKFRRTPKIGMILRWITTRLKHKNLVKLMGFCIQQQEIILCFEFMPNHSLDLLLFGIILEEEVELNWEQRFRLIQGISSGLLCLHEDNGDTVIHRDVKPANILLDKDMVPKISDFGISRLFEEDRSFFTTSTIGGTRIFCTRPIRYCNDLDLSIDKRTVGREQLLLIGPAKISNGGSCNDRTGEEASPSVEDSVAQISAD